MALRRDKNIGTGRDRALPAFLILLVVAAAVVAAMRIASGPPAGGFVNAKFERYLGRRVAEVAAESAEAVRGRRVGVLVLIRNLSGPYGARIEGIQAGLEKDGLLAGVYDAFSARFLDEETLLTGATPPLNDEDYHAASIDLALEKLSPDVLVVVSAADFTHIGVTPAMEEFVENGGRFVFVGQIASPYSPVVDLVWEGSAVAIARHTGPLAPLAPPGRSLAAGDPETYFQSYYSVIDSDNFDRFAGLLD